MEIELFSCCLKVKCRCNGECEYQEANGKDYATESIVSPALNPPAYTLLYDGGPGTPNHIAAWSAGAMLGSAVGGTRGAIGGKGRQKRAGYFLSASYLIPSSLLFL